MNYEKILNVYPHNMISYNKIRNAFLSGENIVGIIHATGTGKSYNALLLALENKDKKVLYVSPYKVINKHVKKIIRDNEYLSMEENLPNMSFTTFTGLTLKNDDELSSLDVDILIIDEFHHLGAPQWSKKIDLIIKTHPNLKILGMTAYPIRDRGSIYERDMALTGGDEIFSDHIVSYYGLSEALVDGVLPPFTYYASYNISNDTILALENKMNNTKITYEERVRYNDLLNDAKKMIHKAKNTSELIRNNIFMDGKYYYFCPFKTEDGKNDIETIKNEIRSFFPELSDDDICFYTTTSSMGKVGFENQKAFENDLTLDGKDASSKLRVMFAINQYNEGAHSSGVDGVIMGRNTASEMVFFEQLGRALSVRKDNDERKRKLEKLSLESLKELAFKRKIKGNFTKDELINKLCNSVIIDLTNNIDYIKTLEKNIGTHIREKRKDSTYKLDSFKVKGNLIDIDVQNSDIASILSYVSDRLISTWEDWYLLAENYYHYYHNLNIPARFKTFDGVNEDENGKSLGQWLEAQNRNYHLGTLSNDRIDMLKKIGMSFKSRIFGWQDFYILLCNYNEYYNNTLVPSSFKTYDGINENNKGHDLGRWLQSQNQKYKDHLLEDDKILKLESIGYTFSKKINSWEDNFNIAKAYSEYYGNINVPEGFKTINGIRYDDKGKNLYDWIKNQKKSYNKGTLSNERIKSLEKIGIDFNKKQLTWLESYKIAKKYYEKYGNLEVNEKYVTDNGYTLGNWISRQRTAYNNNDLSEDKIMLLELIDMRFNYLKHKTWDESFALAEQYYLLNGKLVPTSYETEDGYKLGAWMNWQKQLVKNDKLDDDQKEKLYNIGLTVNRRKKGK